MLEQRPAVIAVALMLQLLWGTTVSAGDCHPALDITKPQFVVGYGSLMEAASKRRSEPDAGINLPILVTGFQRAWSTHGMFPTTFLGVRPSASASMVAALYRAYPTGGETRCRFAREILLPCGRRPCLDQYA